jgi:uncharacterized membrane protein
MDWLMLVLRLIHIGGGALWVGMMVFMVFFLTPAIAEAGPQEGGKLMAGLQRRRIMVVMPVIALLTIGSGLWLMMRLYGGPANLAATRMGMALNLGATATILAFLIGIGFMRPAMMRAMVTTDPAEAQRLRARGATLGRVIAWMLLFALGAMAVARYL